MFFIYNILFSLLYCFLFVASKVLPFLKKRNKLLRILELRNSKIKEFFQSPSSLFGSNSSEKRNTIWIHVASMGEFEQVKPVIEKLKRNQPDIQIACSFYSPSGYDTQKNYKFADEICYIPNDNYFTAKKFIKRINPSLVIFVRYELWLNHLHVLRELHIPTFLINATFPSSFMTDSVVKAFVLRVFYKYIFNLFSEIYAVSDSEYNLFQSLNLYSKLVISSDTRNDRILEKVNYAKITPFISKELFNDNDLVLVAGSTWNKDIDIIFNAVTLYAKSSIKNKQLQKIRLIVVPHEPTDTHINYAKTTFSNYILLTEILPQIESINKLDKNADEYKQNVTKLHSMLSNKVIIVDKIGYLLKLYSVADFAYIGGAFGGGVHSITEPAGYGIPLVTGPNCYNSPYTKTLISLQILSVINNDDALGQWLIDMNSLLQRNHIGNTAKQYMTSKAGATEIICQRIADELANII